MASSEWKEIKKIRRTLLALDMAEAAQILKGHRAPADPAEVAAIKGVRREQIELLNRRESEYLIKRAESWGIEVPFKDEWYLGRFKNPDADNIYGDTILVEQEWLNEVGKAVITKQIRDARFAYWKGWVEVLIPILALVVALIALLKN